MDKVDEKILKITKEIVVKFIEAGRVSPNSVHETFKDVYKTYHTIEIVERFYNKTKQRFDNPNIGHNIVFHLGHSPVMIEKILNQIDEPVTFWLDAHYQGGQQPGDTKAPIKDELNVIKNHYIKNHMIMIDDVRLFRQYGTSVNEVTTMLLEINPDYTIERKLGIIEDDVIVAYIK